MVYDASVDLMSLHYYNMKFVVQNIMKTHGVSHYGGEK